jgi:hypothetical protein
MRLTARGGRSTEIALWALAAIGTITFAAYLVDIILRDGGIAYDLHAYILAGRHALEGAPLYAAVQIGDPGAYRYAPTFAYLAIPLALPPELVVTWVYRAACVVCVRALVGSWRAVGIALLFWPVQIELDALNVTLPIAVLARMALRGSTAGVASTPATAALKYGTILLAPYLWLREPRRRRALAIGLGVTVLVFGVHALLRPADWADYVASLGQQSRSVNQAPFAGPQLIVLVPSTLGDFVLRFALCTVLAGIAVWRRWSWLAFAAGALAVPTLWVARLAPLVGVPRMWLEDRSGAAVGGADAPAAPTTTPFGAPGFRRRTD